MSPPAPARPRSPLRRAVDAGWRAALRLGFVGLRLWWRVARPTLHGVYVAVWHEGRLLILRNSYQRAYSVPSGRRGRREAPADAAARELREEVGIDVAADRLVHVETMTVETRHVTDCIDFFELHAEAAPTLAIDHREVVWAAFEAPDAARARPLLPAVARYLAGRRGPSTGPTPAG